MKIAGEVASPYRITFYWKRPKTYWTLSFRGCQDALPRGGIPWPSIGCRRTWSKLEFRRCLRCGEVGARPFLWLCSVFNSRYKGALNRPISWRELFGLLTETLRAQQLPLFEACLLVLWSLECAREVLDASADEPDRCSLCLFGDTWGLCAWGP